ncbi:hypothetical protein Patl1_07479 [Pistacia atlantica]|uniref:Uncharacterized protein n=1 Tax=Pistacia atlantica TaxID=434234 RepID=A0ACC1AKB4_9ROSI|nr:hypothetical protein Patl1_07479 [Pistacia atlantica]
MDSLESLDFSNNQLSGKRPEDLATGCSSLQLLALSNNNLEGLNLGDNHFSGIIPGWLGNMSELVDIIMPNNHLEDLSYDLFNGSLPNWIDRLSLLRYLILAKNNLEGQLSLQLCESDQLRILDLSRNNFKGFIVPCLNISEFYKKGYNATTLASGFKDQAPVYSPLPAFSYSQIGPPSIKKESIEFTMKNGTYSYTGRVLIFMIVIDLSCNKLIGEIPRQMENSTMLISLNFSHNNVIGPIPLEFSNLKQIGSLGLSYNNLNGKIPPKLVEIVNLKVFAVVLSGKTPEYILQFGTFDNGSYEGNPLLCGRPLSKVCNETEPPCSIVTSLIVTSDMSIFYITLPSYIKLFSWDLL